MSLCIVPALGQGWSWGSGWISVSSLAVGEGPGDRWAQEQETDRSPLSRRGTWTDRYCGCGSRHGAACDPGMVSRGAGRGGEGGGVERQAQRRWPELGPCAAVGSLGAGPGQGSWQRGGRKPEATGISLPVLGIPPNYHQGTPHRVPSL